MRILSKGEHNKEEKERIKKPRDSSPSGKFAAVVWKMLHEGFTVDMIEAKLTDHPDGIGKRYQDQGRLREEIERCHEDWVKTGGVTLEDFRAYMPDHDYVYMPTREHWPASSVNSLIPPVAHVDDDGNPVLGANGKPVKVKANAWLDTHRPVEQKTWVPGEPAIIHDRLVSDGA